MALECSFFCGRAAGLANACEKATHESSYTIEAYTPVHSSRIGRRIL